MDGVRPEIESAGTAGSAKPHLPNARTPGAQPQIGGLPPMVGGTRVPAPSQGLQPRSWNVDDRAGKGIGQITDLVIDMGANKVSYAVLGFDPSWFGKEKLFAFSLTNFVMRNGKDDLVLNVDKPKLEAMKCFDAGRWGHLNDLDRDGFVNGPTPKS